MVVASEAHLILLYSPKYHLYAGFQKINTLLVSNTACSTILISCTVSFHMMYQCLHKMISPMPYQYSFSTVSPIILWIAKNSTQTLCACYERKLRRHRKNNVCALPFLQHVQFNPQSNRFISPILLCKLLNDLSVHYITSLTHQPIHCMPLMCSKCTELYIFQSDFTMH